MLPYTHPLTVDTIAAVLPLKNETVIFVIDKDFTVITNGRPSICQGEFR